MKRVFRFSVYVLLIMSWLGVGAILTELWSPLWYVHFVSCFFYGWYVSDIVQYLIGDTGKKVKVNA